MLATFERPSLWRRASPLWRGLDGVLFLAALLLAFAGLLTMYSVGFDHGTRFADHARNMLIAACVMVLVAQIAPQQLMSLAVPLYALGLALLLAVAWFGLSRKGATRWLSLGVTVIQPSEILKIAMPMMLAWWFHRREGHLRPVDFVVAAALLAIPVALIAKQPDLGTAILVLAAGVYVIFFAGLDWRII